MPDKEPKIVGWRIQVYQTDPRLGRIPHFNCEYGNSPIRDRRAREAYEAELRAAGHDFETRPILSPAPEKISPSWLRSTHLVPLTWLARQKKPVPADKFPDWWGYRPSDLANKRIGRHKVVSTRRAADGTLCYAITPTGRQMVDSHAA